MGQGKGEDMVGSPSREQAKTTTTAEVSGGGGSGQEMQGSM
jgi:hypothetical protein